MTSRRTKILDIVPPFAFAGIPPVSEDDRERVIAVLSCVFGPPAELHGFPARNTRLTRQLVYSWTDKEVRLMKRSLSQRTLKGARDIGSARLHT